MNARLNSRAWGWLLVVFAGLMFLVRGPLRGIRAGDDLAPPYGGAKAWALGLDPYAHTSVGAVLLESGRETDAEGHPRFNPSLYPPPSFLALAPLAPLRWPVARVAFLLFALSVVAWQIPALLRLAGLSFQDTAGVWLLAGVLALAPYHTGIALGQVATPSAALLVVAIDRIERDDEWLGGVLLALATLFKPQLAGPFILFYSLRQRGRAAGIALGMCVVATMVSVGWMAVNHIHWLESWRATTATILVPGSEHDPAGPWSPQLLELRPLISVLTGNRSPGVIGFSIAAALGVWVYAVGRRLSGEHNLLLLSTVALLSLFAIYHRFYDAATLTLPLAWSVAVVTKNRPFRRPAVVVAVCCAVFFAPGAWMLQRFATEGLVPIAWTRTFLWNGVLLRHQNWSLVVMFGALAVAIWRARQMESSSAPTRV